MNSLIFEIGIICLFLFCIYNARKSWKNLGLLFLGFFYAIIFENFNVIMSSGKIGGYFYSSNFNIFIGHLPLLVALSWAILIYSTYHFVNYIGIASNRKAFADAFFITLVDIAIDPIASGIGLWKWVGYSVKDGFFGVPGNNFLGWLVISFVFMFLFRYITKRKKFKMSKSLYLLLPIVSYFIFLVIFAIFGKIQELLNFNKTAEAIMFFAIYFIFLFLIKRDKKEKTYFNSLNWVYIIRGMFYLFGIIGIIYLGILDNLLIFINLVAIMFIEVVVYFKFIRK